jgi:hypothetical protein
MYVPRFVKKLVIIIPAIVTFLIALTVTLKYQWPLGSDIFYHLHMAQLYSEQGFTYWDNLTAAPYGRPITYPPLFHLVIIVVKYISGNIYAGARLLQPILASLVVLSFSYMAQKLSKKLIVGVSAGFFLISSLAFSRFIIAGPEALALIIFPWAIYFFYNSIEKDNNYPAAFSGVLSGLIFLTHVLSATCLLIFTIPYTIIISWRNKNAFHYLIIFLLSTFLISAIWWLPLLIKYGFVYNINADIPVGVSVLKYPAYFGVLTLIFAVLGAVLMIKKRENSDILLLTLLASLLIYANLNFFGIPIFSYRILTFAVLPLAILAGWGIYYLRYILAEKKISSKIFYILVGLVYLSSVLTANSMMVDFEPTPSWMRVSEAELDVAEWFNVNGDKKRVVVSANFRDPLIVAMARQPVALGGYGQGIPKSLDLNKYIYGDPLPQDYINDQVGYVVLYNGMNPPKNAKLVYQNINFSIYQFQPL